METKRLFIEAMDKDDRYELYQYYKQAACFTYLSIDVIKDINDMDDLYEQLYANEEAYCLYLKTSDVLIGDVSFYMEDERLYLYYILDPKYWHQGYMFEALQLLLKNKKIIYAKVMHEHKRSITLLKKLGFTHVDEIQDKNKVIDVFELRKEG